MNIIVKLISDACSFVFWFIFISIILIMVLGCSTRTIYQTKTQEVYIPVKCEVTRLPETPKMKPNIYHTLNDVLIYAEQLKTIVDGCVVESVNN